jgi:NADH-quinone oxidoreductase subunit N
VINSVIGLFYYLRVIVALYSKPFGQNKNAALIAGDGHPTVSFSFASGAVLSILTLLLIWIGIYPTPFIRLIQAMATGFSLMR